MRSSRIWPIVAAGFGVLAAGIGLGRVLAKPAVVTEPARQLAIDLPDSIRVAFKAISTLPVAKAR
jgi:hypothetical protein